MANSERITFVRFVSGLLNAAHTVAGYVYIFLSLSNMKQGAETPLELELHRVIAGLIVNIIGTSGLMGIAMENVRIIILSNITAVTYLVFATLKFAIILFSDYKHRYSSIYKSDLVFTIWTIIGSITLQLLSWPIIYYIRMNMRYMARFDTPYESEESAKEDIYNSGHR